MPFAKTPHHPRIILDCDDTITTIVIEPSTNGTCRKNNVAMAGALQFLKISHVAMNTAFGSSGIAFAASSNNTRDESIQWLTQHGIETEYVVMTHSNVLDKNDGLGSYYKNHIQPLEKKFQQQANNQEAMVARNKLNKKEDRINTHKSQIETNIKTINDPSTAKPIKDANIETKDKTIKALKTISNNGNIVVEQQLLEDEYTGGKEIMLAHIIQNDKEAKAFIMLDDKKEVITTVKRMNQGDLHPQAKGKIHAIHVNMSDKNQDRNFYIRHLIQGYKPEHLLETLNKFEICLDGEKLNRKIYDAKSAPGNYTEDDLKILARLVLMKINPNDYINIVETAEAISNSQNSDWDFIFNETIEEVINQSDSRLCFLLGNYYHHHQSFITNLNIQSNIDCRLKNRVKQLNNKRDYTGYSALQAGLISLKANINSINIFDFLVLSNNASEQPIDKNTTQEELINVFREKSNIKSFSTKNYLSCVVNLDAILQQFCTDELKQEFKDLLQNKFSNRFASMFTTKTKEINIKNLTELINLQANENGKNILLGLLSILKNNNYELHVNTNISELVAHLYLAHRDPNNLYNIEAIYKILCSLDTAKFEAIHIYTHTYLSEYVFNQSKINDTTIKNISEYYGKVDLAFCKNHFEYNIKSNALRELLNEENAINLTLLAQGVFTNSGMSFLLEMLIQNNKLSTNVFSAIAVLAKKNPEKAHAVLTHIADGKVNINESKAFNFDSANCQEKNITKDSFLYQLKACLSKDEVKNSPEALITLTNAMQMITNPTDIRHCFYVANDLKNSKLKDLMGEDFFTQLKTIEQIIFAHENPDNNKLDQAKSALQLLKQFIDLERNQVKKEGLTMIYSSAKTILNDNNRSEKTRGLASSVVLRSTQLLLDPEHQENKTQLDNLLSTFKENRSTSERVGDKLTRGLELFLTGLQTIGLDFAKSYRMKIQSRPMLQKGADSFIKAAAPVA